MYAFHVVFNGVSGGEVRISVQIICIIVIVIEDALFFCVSVAVLGCKLVKWVVWLLCTFCLNWEVCSLKCMLMGRIDVSTFKCCVLVSCMHLVMVLSA